MPQAAFLELLASASAVLKQLGVAYQVVLLLTGADDNEKRELKGMLSSINSVQVETGRLSAKLLSDHLSAKMEREHVEGFICGPAGFESAARGMWTAAGLSSSAIRSESFMY